MAGFGKPKGGDSVLKSKIPLPSASCACGSGNSYDSCCQPFHMGKAYPEDPIEVLRARFSALSYGVPGFLMRSTHPDMKEYAAENEEKVGSRRSKREIWEKNLQSFSDDFEFMNLKFPDGSDPEAVVADGSDEAVVAVTLERRMNGAMSWDNIDEKTKFKKNATTGEWLYFSANLVNKGVMLSSGQKPTQKMMKTNKRGVPSGN